MTTKIPMASFVFAHCQTYLRTVELRSRSAVGRGIGSTTATARFTEIVAIASVPTGRARETNMSDITPNRSGASNQKRQVLGEGEKMREAQELHCHDCDRYVQFTLDLSANGNYVLDCPNCGHKHYRVVKNGQVSDARWGRDPSQTGWNTVTATSSSTVSVDSISTGGSSTSAFITQAWYNTSSSTTFA